MLKINLELPDEIRKVELTKNSPLKLKFHTSKHVNDLIEDGVLLCQCMECGEQFLLFSCIGTIACPVCGGRATKQWRKLKLCLLPEGVHNGRNKS